jgi:hypothetical protein
MVLDDKRPAAAYNIFSHHPRAAREDLDGQIAST